MFCLNSIYGFFTQNYKLKYLKAYLTGLQHTQLKPSLEIEYHILKLLHSLAAPAHSQKDFVKGSENSAPVKNLDKNIDKAKKKNFDR